MIPITQGGFVHVEGEALNELIRELGEVLARGTVHCLRIGADDGQAKWSIDHGVWTPPMGAVVGD